MVYNPAEQPEDAPADVQLDGDGCIRVDRAGHAEREAFFGNVQELTT